ncbi:hypothetical protein EDEG_01249, partial [Edhazardia aedis USNM 41457]
SMDQEEIIDKAVVKNSEFTDSQAEIIDYEEIIDKAVIKKLDFCLSLIEIEEYYIKSVNNSENYSHNSTNEVSQELYHKQELLMGKDFREKLKLLNNAIQLRESLEVNQMFNPQISDAQRNKQEDTDSYESVEYLEYEV